MKITFPSPYLKNNNIRKCDFHSGYPNFAPLKYDTVTFGAIKKKEFEGIDIAVVEKFKAPIEKFNTNADLQKWAMNKTLEIANKDFGGRQEETKIQRKEMLKEWSDYVLKENDGYTNTMALLILDAVTKPLKPDSDAVLPVLNKGVLADCIEEIDKNTKQNPKYQFNLNKMYKNKLQAFYLGDEQTNTGETVTKWVKIPSYEHDPEHFEENVEKLKELSYKNWCTKSFNAKPYLREGDFHIYFENGHPKIGVRFVSDEIQEIQGELNNGKIPLQYMNTVEKHINDEGLQLTPEAKGEINNAKILEEKAIKIRANFKEAIEQNDAEKIFNYFGIIVSVEDDGLFTISEYRQPSCDFTYSDIGIDENKLFEKVKRIKGYADFSNSQITDLRNLQSIGTNAFFEYSQIKSLGNLKSIGGSAAFSYSQITDLGNLQSIGGYVDFRNSQVVNLGNLKSIGRNACFGHSKITSLGNLESIGGNANFEHSQVTDLGKLKNVEGKIFYDTPEMKNFLDERGLI